MHTLVVGLNHTTAPIEVREALYLRGPERELLLSELKNDPSVAEAIVLSTCNRTEIYANVIDADPELLLKKMFSIKKLPFNLNFKKHFYVYHGQKAVSHLLRVSSGLDSLILGERQILGQLKEAVALSRKKGTLSKEFNILSHIAIRTGKKARNETQINCGGSSVSWAAVAMADKILKTLKNRSALIIGVGKMSHLAVGYLKKKGMDAIYIMNRTLEHSQSLAREAGGIAVSFWEIKEILKKVDVCICATGCPNYLIEKGLVEKVMGERQQAPLVFIDISMPRNINPEVSSLENITLMAIDDLKRVREDNIEKRSESISQVEAIIAKKVDEFYLKVSKNSLAKVMEFEESIKII